MKRKNCGNGESNKLIYSMLKYALMESVGRL
jgi:hypothetical protein